MNKLPEGIKLSCFQDNYRLAVTEYSKAHRRARQLDAVDRGKLWSTLAAKYPSYQILPETNHVSYVKNNILASIYTVNKSAKLLATSEHDKDIIENLNIALDHVWATRDIGWYQMLAGERAALLNLGVTQVGWDASIITGKDKTFEKGQVILKNIDPLKYFRDPFADSIDTAQFVMTWDDYHESVIVSNPDYKAAFKTLKENGTLGTTSDSGYVINTDKASQTPAGKRGYYRIVIHWLRVEDKIHEIHLLNNAHVLHVVEDIRPRMFPFAELYCNLPAGDLMGTSEPAKILANSVAYNILQSMMLTAEYKNQRPPRFVNGASGINVNTFTKHGNDADRTFVVNGDARMAVQYHQFPQPSPQAITNMGMLAADIQLVTGVDGRYTGRDTGSILTTGGINSMLDQATLIDSTKVACYQKYCKDLSKLVIYNYISNSTRERNYLVKDKNKVESYKTVKVNFPAIPIETVFEYEIMISSELPKNKARLETVANKIMEMQMQYKGAGIDVDLITPNEWLEMQDIPNREYMLERMNLQRTQNWTTLVAQAVTQYAGLVEQGLDSTDAMRMTAQTMMQEQQPGGSDLDSIAEDAQLFGGMPPIV